MRITRKLVLLALTALAAMAFAASTASASPVEFETEAGVPCNPCAVHVVGEFSIFAADMATHIFPCTDEFSARLYHNGSGEIEWSGRLDTAGTTSNPGCNTANCTAPNSHWTVSNANETAANTVTVDMLFCLNGLQCLGTPTVTEPSTHSYRFSLDTECFFGARRIIGMWDTEADSDFEIDHL